MFTKLRRFQRQEKGFTLVELLIVIAIMAVLIGVAVTSFTGLIGSGSDESKDFELDAVQTAVDAYMAVQKVTTITTRAVADEIESGDIAGDAPFATYLRRLPTEYQYTWTAAGTVTQN